MKNQSVSVNQANFVSVALGHASFHRDDSLWVAEVPGLPGVLASGASLNACLSELREVVGGWVEVRKRHGLPIPSLKFGSLSVSAAT